MKTIHKFLVTIDEVVSIFLPRNAEVLSFMMQNESLFIWVLLDKNKEKTIERKFTVIGTGWEDKNKALEQHRFIGTAFTEGSFVWHCFEVWKR